MNFSRVTTYLRDRLLNFSNRQSPIANPQHPFAFSVINEEKCWRDSVVVRASTLLIVLIVKRCCGLAIGECGLLNSRVWSLKYVVTLKQEGAGP